MSWLVPMRGRLHAVPRMVVGALGNVTLSIYLAPRVGRMSDIAAYPHLTANPIWVCAELGTPLVILLIMSPLCFSKQMADRWAALGLSLYQLAFLYVKGLGFLARGYN
jgi:hypothetical protein